MVLIAHRLALRGLVHGEVVARRAAQIVERVAIHSGIADGGTAGVLRACALNVGISQILIHQCRHRSTCRNLVACKHDVLEVIRTLVAVFIPHPVDHTLAVRRVSPRKARSVVVQAVLQLPSLQLRILEVRVAAVMHSPCLFRKLRLSRSQHQKVERMPCALRLCLRRRRYEVRDAVHLPWSERTTVAQCLQRGVGRADGLVNLVRNHLVGIARKGVALVQDALYLSTRLGQIVVSHFSCLLFFS